jgi:hypothetical protein
MDHCVRYPYCSAQRRLCPSAHIDFTALPCKSLPEQAFSHIIEAMEVRFTPEQEALLAQIATNAGTDAEQLVKNAALRLLEDNADIPAAAPRPNGELPLFHLGSVGPLHRRDIYDDAR